MEVFSNLNVNRISDEYRAELDEKKLAIGELVQYRLLDGKLNPDPEERRKVGKEIIWPMSQCIVCKDRIKDPFTGKLVDIAVVKEIDKDDRAVVTKLYVPARDQNGFIYVNGGNVDQEKFFEFLEVSNFNKSNPHRDNNIRPLYERIDAVKEAKDKNKSYDTLTEVLQLLRDASLVEIREIGSAYGWDVKVDDDVIRGRLRDLAKKDPEGFKKIVGNKADLSIKSIINEALREGVITHTPTENKYTFTKTEEVIVTLVRKEGVEPTDQLLEWLKTSTTGKTVLKNIKTQLKTENI